MPLLTDAYETQLCQWLKNDGATFNLLYQATKDGCNPTVFHSRCDNQGPTVTVVRSQGGYVLGGYTSLPWSSSGNYKADSQAFLFNLYSNGSYSPYMLGSRNNNQEVYHHSNYGPTFGTGHDLSTFVGAFNYNGTYFPCNCCSSLGNSFNTSSYGNLNNNQYLTEIEVYLVCEGKAEWRDGGGWELEYRDSLLQTVKCFSPPEEVNIPYANVLLIGQVGAGKSSFFNTVKSVIKNRISNHATAGSLSHSVTNKYRMYTVGQGRDQVKIRFCDTMGLEEDQGLDGTDFMYILEGNVPNHFQFNPLVRVSTGSPGFIQNPSVSNKIHCVVFVIDASTFKVMKDKVMYKISGIRDQAMQRDIPCLVLLTKVDKVCPSVDKDLTTVYHSKAVERKVSEVATKLGITESQVLPIKNYSTEIKLDKHVDILTLTAVERMTAALEDHFEEWIEKYGAKELGKLALK